MREPDWSQCNEEEMWHYVAWHLEGAGITTVLVGGAVVAIHTEGLYRSGDLDIITDDFHRDKLRTALAEIGFLPTKSRYYKHPECGHLFLEFPRGPVTPDEVEVGGRTLRLLSPTDSVKDRLAGYIHWASRPHFDQAALICKRQPERVDLAEVRRWCVGEDGVVRRRGRRRCFRRTAAFACGRRLDGTTCGCTIDENNHSLLLAL